MAQNITLLGASYSAVPSVTLPKTGGGTASFTDVTDTTATASDVASGKYFYTASGVRTQGTASGGGGGANIEALSITQNGTYTASGGVDGYSPVTVNVSGGASNFVMGEFNTGATKGTAKEISLAYTGNGYPIAAMVWVKGGAYNSSNTAWYNKVQRYAVGQFTITKSVTGTAPTHTETRPADAAVITCLYKNSTSSATQYSRTSGMDATTYCTSSNTATGGSATVVRFPTNKKMSVYVASTSYGLLDNLDYSYIVVFSS